MIHAPDNTDSIIARLSSLLEFFNSLSHKRKCGAVKSRIKIALPSAYQHQVSGK
jgi:hypothetical protein